MSRPIAIGLMALLFGCLFLGGAKARGDENSVRADKCKVPEPLKSCIAASGGQIVLGKDEGVSYNTVRFIDCDDLCAADITLLMGVPCLTHLDLRLSHVSPEVLLAVVLLREVTDLDLSSTRITDAELPILAAMPCLNHLKLNYTVVTGTGLGCFAQSFKKCPIELELAGTNLRPCDLKQLAGLCLTGINLSDTCADATWLKVLPDKLKILKLARTKMTNDDLTGLVERFKVLAVLDLSENSISDKGVESLGNLDSLTTLDLADATPIPKDPSEPEGIQLRITDKSCEHLSRLPKLEKLYLNGARVTDKGVSTTLKNNISIKGLWLRGTPTTGMFEVPKNSELKTLELSGTPIKKNGVKNCMKFSPLKHLWLLSTNLDDKTFASALVGVTIPKDLTIHVGGKITSIGLLDLMSESSGRKEPATHLHIVESKRTSAPKAPVSP